MSEPMGILIADGNPLVLRGLSAVLEEDGRFRPSAQAAAGQELLALFDRRPETIAISEWSMPDMTAEDILADLRRRGVKRRLIVYTDSKNSDLPRRVMAAGGFGFCAKTDPLDLLLNTVAAVAHGRIAFPYVDVKSLYADPLAQLTAREKELLSALAGGWTNQQIASRYGISPNTVKFHLKNLYEKLDVSNRASAVALYFENERPNG